MFFDPKMQLVWVDGPLEKLDAFIENCCVDGKRVHPARAPDHMSASAGYAALNEENPWGPLVEQIEALAKGFEIPVVEPTLADGRAQGTRDYLADLQARLGPTARTGICWKSSWRSAQKAPSPSPISPRWMFRWN